MDDVISKRIKQHRKLLFDKSDLPIFTINQHMLNMDNILLYNLIKSEIKKLYVYLNDSDCKVVSSVISLTDAYLIKHEIPFIEAKKGILTLHKRAREAPFFKSQILRAIAQGLSVIHVKTHGIGFIIYLLSAYLHKDPKYPYQQDLMYYQTLFFV